jgi:hypothetical protein
MAGSGLQFAPGVVKAFARAEKQIDAFRAASA